MRLTNEELQTAIDNALCKKVCLAVLNENDYDLNNYLQALYSEQKSRLYEQPMEDKDAKSTND